MMTTSEPLTATASTKDRHVFLSYSSQDRDLALRLKHALEAYGINVWIDLDRMRSGSLIVTELEQAIDNASAFVVLVSAASLSSGWVREECGRAIALSIQSAFRLPIIPIAVEGAAIPGFLANRSALQLPDRNYLSSVASTIAATLSTNAVFAPGHERKTKIRWHSRCEGFTNGDVSVLAIIETIAAMAIAISLSTSSGSLTYLAASALIAPLALLQSDQSRSIGIRWLRRLQWWTRLKPAAENDSRIAKTIRTSTLAFVFLLRITDFAQLLPSLHSLVIGLIGTLLFLIMLGMMLPLLVRSAATLCVAIRHPITTLQVMPTNWKNLILCKDLLEEPEVVPGYLEAVSTGELSNDLRFPNLINGLTQPLTPKVLCDCGLGPILHAFMIVCFALPTMILLYAPYYSARWALKSTAIIWAPLLWVASAMNGSTLPLRLRLQILAEDATNKTVVAFSWLAPAFLLALWQGLLPPSLGKASSINWIVVFAQQPLSEFCVAGAALVAIGLHLIASRILLLYSHETLPLVVIRYETTRRHQWNTSEIPRTESRQGSLSMQENC